MTRPARKIRATKDIEDLQSAKRRNEIVADLLREWHVPICGTLEGLQAMQEKVGDPNV